MRNIFPRLAADNTDEQGGEDGVECRAELPSTAASLQSGSE